MDLTKLSDEDLMALLLLSIFQYQAKDFFTKSLETQGAAAAGGALASGAARESDVGPVVKH
jgi:hypothetical protein